MGSAFNCIGTKASRLFFKRKERQAITTKMSTNQGEYLSATESNQALIENWLGQNTNGYSSSTDWHLERWLAQEPSEEPWNALYKPKSNDSAVRRRRSADDNVQGVGTVGSNEKGNDGNEGKKGTQGT
jgi:hypothetical protein